jgi:thioredoxin-related protein
MGAMRAKRLWAAAWLAAVVALGGLAATAAEGKRVEPRLLEDGLYTQDWFLQSFLDLKLDLADTAAGGKRLAILWEQRGCPYCKDMHTINFADPEINDYVRANFNVIQLNLWGDRPVTDFDGQEMSEKALARKWGIIYTPTLQFLPESVAEVGSKNGRDAEVMRMPGYFRPFHFSAMFHYVREKRYADLHFQRYLDEYRERLRAQGKNAPM